MNDEPMSTGEGIAAATAILGVLAFQALELVLMFVFLFWVGWLIMWPFWLVLRLFGLEV